MQKEPTVIQLLSEAWIAAKEVESAAIEKRREIEDQLSQQFGIPEEWEGSKTLHDDGVKILVKRTMSKNIDGDTLQAVAVMNGLTEYLPVLFRWKPEINKSQWQDADEGVTRILSEAITTKPGRVSYKIEREEKE